MTPAAATPAPERPDFWQRTKVGWLVVHLGLVGVLAVLVFSESVASLGQAAVWVGALAVVAGAYLLVGRRALGADRLDLALAYLVPVWAAFFVLLVLDEAAMLLLFALMPQVWACLPRTWQAAVWTLGASVGIFLALRGEKGTAEAAVTMAINAGLALLLGLWITGIINESARRADLIEELHRTRHELTVAEREAGALAERARLAGEIHDTLAQGFTSILTLAQAVEAALDGNNDDDRDAARERLALLERTARDGLAEARALVADLGPVDLHRGSLPEAMRRLVDRFAEEVGVPAELVVSGDAHPLSPNAEVVLLRATQEALANVRRHSSATAVQVRLLYGGGSAEVVVADDGKGFDPAATLAGYGLPGLRLRAAQVAGQVDVDSEPGRGTTVRVGVPAASELPA